MRKLLLFLIIFSSFSSLSQRDNPSYQVTFLRDQRGKVSAENIVQNDFQSMPSSESFGIKNGQYWFKILVEVEQPKSERIILQIPTHNIGNTRIYEKISDTVVFLAESQNQRNSIVIAERFPTFLLPTKGESILEYYINVNFHKEANFPVRVFSESNYFEITARYDAFTGGYYGFLIAIVICNLFFFIKFEEKVYLYYIIFLCSYTAAILFRDGTMNLIFPAEIPVDLEVFSHLLTEITMFLFVFVFLDFRKHLPKFEKYAVGLVLSMVLMNLLYTITGDFLYYVLGDLIAMMSFFTAWVISILFMRKIKYTRFYILGYSILVIFGFHFLFSYDFGYIPNNARTIFLKVASIVDMLIFTYAISYRADLLNKEYRSMIKQLRELMQAQESVDKQSMYSLLEENPISNKTLTVQEVKVLRFIHKGFTNREIAESLFVSGHTVKFHVKNIYKKLEVKNRQEAKSKLAGFNDVSL